MSFQAIAAQLEFLAWTDAQLAAISMQMEEAFPALLDDLAAQAERAGLLNLVRSTVALKSAAETTIQDWGARQLDVALRRAEEELDRAILQLPGSVNLGSDIWDQVGSDAQIG